MARDRAVQTKVAVKDVKKGMFISELDRPWIDSPFLLQGFTIGTDEEIEKIKACCKYIFIDTSQGDQSVVSAHSSSDQNSGVEITKSTLVSSSPIPESKGSHSPALVANDKALAANNNEVTSKVKSAKPANKTNELSKKEVNNRREVHALLNLPSRFVEYQVSTTIEKEIEKAKVVQQELQESISSSMDKFHQSQDLDLGSIKESTGELVESMIRNPDAAFLLSQLKEMDSFTYTHSVDASILAILFGRHMGLTVAELNTLALGVLFLDIGKTRLPKAMLEKRGKLAPAEIMLLRKHVQFSLIILSAAGIDKDALIIVANHHERFDGRGYPKRKREAEIPVFAKIASIVDFYDAITHNRPYRKALPTGRAINALYERRGLQFQAELIEEFIQCLGVYPTGSLVLLSTGEAGIVVSQNQVRRLRPKVLIVRDELKQDVTTPYTRDLDIDQIDSDGRRVYIQIALEAGAYGISADDYYL
jgi:HD-GYP domain-containing protein (c-di-GMP phosphodiesterase class II)